jgi:hypothetical protein
MSPKLKTKMAKSKKIDWVAGDVFLIPLKNGKYSVGHALDQRMVNAVRIALYDELVDLHEKPVVDVLCNINNLISLIEVTKEQLTYGVWKIIGNKKTDIPISRYANEQYRNNKWIGSTIYDAALAEDFVNAFYCLLPWDDWYDPNFLDKFLADINKKPKKLIFVKS